MRKVLFLVNEINSANGLCCRGIMQGMKSNDYKIFCVTNNEDKRLVDYVDENVQYYTVKPRLCYRLQKKYLRENNVFRKSLYRTAFKILNRIKSAISVFSWPLISRSYKNRIYRKALNLVKEESIDIIICVNTQIDTLIVGKQIKNKFPQIKYYAYMLDSLAAGYGPRFFSKKYLIKRGLRWEQKVFINADKIIMMKSAEDFYKERKNLFYYDKIVFLDLPLFIPHKQVYEEKNSIVNLLYVGTIPVHIRNPKYFIECFMNIKNENLRFTIIGNSTCEQYLNECVKTDNRIKVLPFMSHNEVIREIEKADFLVNFGNSNKNMTPSKVFEYMSYGKPIISTAPIEEEPSINYLKKYPLTCILYEKDNKVDNIEKLLEFIQNNYNKSVNSSDLINELYLNTPNAFIEQLNYEDS